LDSSFSPALLGLEIASESERVKIESLDASLWEEIDPCAVKLPATFLATESVLQKAPIERVVSGAEALRPGYLPLLAQMEVGRFIIKDGHHRIAMHLLMGSPEMRSLVLKVN